MTRAIQLLIALAIVSLAGLAQAQEPGEDLYIGECAGCHGPTGGGTSWAPSIVEEGAAGADYMMRTGRMPLRRPGDPITEGPPKLTAEQIGLISGYVGRLGGPPIPDPQPQSGDAGTGAELYLVNCAACHGATGVGAALPNNVNPPSVIDASALDIAEAVRSGPLAMPSYSPESISDRELDSLILYIFTLAERRNAGGWDLGRWGPVAEGAAAWLIGVGLVVAAASWIEGRSDEDEKEAE